MIRIETLFVEEFRGIRKLKLEISRRNFAVCGPNGTGKSGIVDALEFAITGAVSRLSGEGTSTITVKAHAPHVDHRDQPEKARVVLTAFIPALKKTVIIERCVSAPSAPIIDSNDPDVLAVVAELEGHPEFALSRREIIKYVLAPPGQRSKEIQALLRLDRIEKVRQSLQAISNSLRVDGRRIELELSQAQTQLLRALGIPQLVKDRIIEAVNVRRQVLLLEPLNDIRSDTSLKLGVAAPPAGKQAKQKIAKKQALNDLDAFEERLKTPEKEQVSKSRAEVAAIMRKLLDSPSLLKSLRREDFLRTGLDLIEMDSCPFCDTSWDMAALKSHVEHTLQEAEKATVLKRELEHVGQPLIAAFRELETLTTTVAEYGNNLSPATDIGPLAAWTATIRLRREGISNLGNLEIAVADLSGDYRQTPELVIKAVSKVRQGVEALPDPSKEEEAKEYLTVCQERLGVYHEVRRKKETNKKQSELASKIFDVYNASSTAVLGKIYEDVEEDFGKYYRFINREDETEFRGKLTPSLGKLEFDVDFYRRGFFPPGAYHSEGHQDAMGLCLYLALMKHTLGAKFAFAVLDDVLMSVDAGHRREVCALLKSEFPNTQFIVTTHDQIWLKHMVSEQMIAPKDFVHFRKWTIDDGPLRWDGVDVWKEIADRLDRDEIPEAAGTLRRFLEYMGTMLSERLRASIEFRGDAQYELGELLPAVVQTWSELLRKAQESANSWDKKEVKGRLAKRQEEFSRCVAQSQVEQWAINSSIHYNEWAKLGKCDFAPVVKAFKSLLTCFCCESCGGFAYVTPPKGSREGIRCACGDLNFNLKKRP